MVIMYEERRADMVSELMAFRVVVEPMLIRDVREAMMKERKTAWRGIFQPGWTYGLGQYVLVRCGEYLRVR